MDKSLFFIIFASNMKFNRCYLKRIVLLFLVALGIKILFMQITGENTG